MTLLKKKIVEEKDESNAPSCVSDVWTKFAEHFVPLLTQPRSWHELKAVAHAQGMRDKELRHTLAWLSVQGLAQAVPMKHDGQVQTIWILRAHVDDEAAIVASTCKHCQGFIAHDRCLLCGRPA